MYEELKKLAEKAGSAEWIMIDGDGGIEADSRFITSERRILEVKIPFAEIHYGHPAAGMLEPFQGEQVAAAAFIAAANPSAVLALIAAHEMEKGSVDEWQDLAARRATRMTELMTEVDRLKAENEELVTALNEILRVTPMGVEAFGIAALVLGELGVTKDVDQ